MAKDDITINRVSGWTGWIYFAALMILLIGIFQLIIGLTALVNSDFYVIEANTLVVYDITTWGWAHLLLGLALVCTGIALFSGTTWARVVAVILVAINFVVHFAFIGVYPLWSIVILILDLLILYALMVHGNELKDNFLE